MKSKTLILTLCLASLMASCSGSGNISLSVSDSSAQEEQSSTESSSSAESSSSSEAFHVGEELVGRWYITSSSMGVLPLNGIFDIADDDTLSIGERTLTLRGHYANYDETYLFVYGSIQFIVSYDADKKGLDWGYANGDDQDYGFAESEPINNGYAYEGSDYPMETINKYIGTSGSVPAYESSTYKLKLFTSYYNAKPCGGLEIPSTTLDAMKSYIDSLIEAGYAFPKYGGVAAAGSFYVGYDADKIYTLRIIFFSDDSEVDIFYHAYDETLLPKQEASSNE